MSVMSQRLEGEKEALERDLTFKADQARQYDSLLEAVRENNRQLQVPENEILSKITNVYPSAQFTGSTEKHDAFFLLSRCL